MNDWILVSEKLPEVESEILVTYEWEEPAVNRRGRRVDMAYYAQLYGDDEPKWYWCDRGVDDGHNEDFIEGVIAWMPLPTAYNGGI